MKKKIILTLTLVLILCFIFIPLVNYLYIFSNQDKIIETCEYSNEKKCIGLTFTLMLPKLLINNVKINGKNIKILIFDWKRRYLSEYAAKKSEALMSYGSMYDIQFENDYTSHLNKNAYIFDCGVEKIPYLNDKEFFYSECIGTDKYLLENQVSSKKIHNFGDKLKELGLENKKIYLKMDIAGAEADVLPDVLKYSDQITGINLALHVNNPKYIVERLRTMDELNKNFVLITRSTFKVDNIPNFKMFSPFFQGHLVDYTLELSFVNKNLLDSYNISLIQNTDMLFKINKKNFISLTDYPIEKNTYTDIRYIVPLIEIIKEQSNKIWKKPF